MGMFSGSRRPLPGLAIVLSAWMGLVLLGCGPDDSTGPDASPACSVSPPALSFAEVPVGEARSLDLTVRNSGGGTLAGTVPPACGDFTIVRGSGGFSLAADESLAVQVDFRPRAAGPRSCTLSLGLRSVPLTGTGIMPACLLEPASLDFGAVPDTLFSVARSFLIRNPGSVALTGELSDLACDEFLITEPAAPSFTLAPGDSLRVTVEFSPDALGQRSCELETGLESCPRLLCSALVTNTLSAGWIDMDYDEDDDRNEDGFPHTQTLTADLDVSQGSLRVFLRVYYRRTGTSDWILYGKTAEKTLHEDNEDAFTMNIGKSGAWLPHGTYDFQIEVVPADATTPLWIIAPDDEPVLSEVPLESQSQDHS